MPLHQGNRRLREGAPIEEISIVGENCNARGDFHCPRTPRLGYTQLGSERPSENTPFSTKLWLEITRPGRCGAVPTGLFIQSLNEMIDDQGKRLSALRNRIPN